MLELIDKGNNQKKVSGNSTTGHPLCEQQESYHYAFSIWKTYKISGKVWKILKLVTRKTFANEYSTGTPSECTVTHYDSMSLLTNNILTVVVIISSVQLSSNSPTMCLFHF
jgi:hypothetical protein